MKKNESSGKTDEKTIDLGKIKSFFSSGKKDKSYSKYKKYKILILLLIPLILCFYLRMMPAYLPITDDWAKSTVNSYYSNQIRSEINSQYAYLPEENKNAIIKTQLAELRKTQGDEIEKQIKELSVQYKAHLQDKDGQTYLIAIDPYMHYRLSKNIFENGHPGDVLVNGTIPWNNHMIAPIGKAVNENLHNYVGVLIYNIFSFFDHDISYMGSFFYIPVIFSLITIIPAFFIARRIAGDLGGLFASIIVAIHPSFLTRTAGGFADTDVYNIMFPLYITWFFIIALESKDTKKKLLFSGLAGLLTAVFSFTWAGWWYVFDFIFAAIGAYVIYIVAKAIISRYKNFKSDIKDVLVFSVGYFFSSLIFVSWIESFKIFTKAFTGPFKFMIIQQASKATLWPNVYTTVAELNVSSLTSIINNAGGSLLIIVGLMGILLAMTNLKKIRRNEYILLGLSAIYYIILVSLSRFFSGFTNGRFIFLIGLAIPILVALYQSIRENKTINPKLSIILGLWFIGTIYASTNGIRFVMLLIPALSIAIGIAVGVLYNLLNNLVVKSFNVTPIISKIVLIILALLLLWQPMEVALKTAENEIPSMNDAWYSALTKINKESAQDAIINSWWDFGHWFKAIGDRAVTFDGASQNRPQAHWIGRALLTNNETEAIAILRMLDCGGNTAFDELDKFIDNPITSVAVIKEIIMLEKGDVKEVLTEYLDDESVIDTIIERTHCEPPEDYFIASEDMVGKAGVWAHFGSWDFNKAWMWVNIRKEPFANGVAMLKEKFNFTDEDATEYYYKIESLEEGKDANTWISPWPGYVTSVANCKQQGTELAPSFICNNGVIINMSDFEDVRVSLDTGQGLASPASFVYPVASGLRKVEFDNKNTLPYSVALITDNGNYGSIVMDKKLVDSMFTRLFFYGGQGLKHFNIFDSKSSLTGENIFVYKIDWEGKVLLKIPEYMEVKASHILLKSQDVADKVYAMFLNGTPFETLAQNFSVDSSAVNSGDLGYFGKNVMIPEFEDALMKLDIGEVSEPVQSSFGWHIIKLTDKKEKDAQELGLVTEPEIEVVPEINPESNASAVVVS